MDLDKRILQIIKEEINQPQEELSPIKLKLKRMVDTIGYDKTFIAVGGVNNFIKIFYDGDLKQYYIDTNRKPYKIYGFDDINMYLDDAFVQTLDLPTKLYLGKGEKELGKFKFNSGGIQYSINISLRENVWFEPDKPKWRVIGISGDSGFGYSFISKRNILKKRSRRGIFNQIIDKYNLNEY